MVWMLALLACGGGEEPEVTPQPDDGVTWHKDIAPLMAERCVECHDGSGAAPFALDNYADASQWASASVAAVQTGRMPPWMPDPDCRDYVGQRVMAPDEVALLEAWLEQDTPEGDAATATPIDEPEEVAFEPTHTATGAGGYVSTAVTSDDYRCFVTDYVAEETVYMTASHVSPGTPQVHHVLVYGLEGDALEQAIAEDAKDETPGYTCFGGPIPQSSEDGQQYLPLQLGAWVPGNKPAVFEGDSGIRLNAGTRVVMQVHYSAVGGEPAPDNGTEVQFRMQTEPTAFLALTRPLPILDLYLPAGDGDVEFRQGFRNYTDQPVNIVSMSGHMHLLGKQIALKQTSDATGEEECLIDIPDWDFGWQQAYRPLPEEPVVVQPGDRIELLCRYDNSQDNQPFVDGVQVSSADVEWGDGTLDEMCLLYYTELKPWEPARPVGLCAGAEACDCEPTDMACWMSCDEVDAECQICALAELYQCGLNSCLLDFYNIDNTDCIGECGLNAVVFAGTMGDCMAEECTAEFDSLNSCLMATQEPGGVCEAALSACNL